MLLSFISLFSGFLFSSVIFIYLPSFPCAQGIRLQSRFSHQYFCHAICMPCIPSCLPFSLLHQQERRLLRCFGIWGRLLPYKFFLLSFPLSSFHALFPS